MFLASLLIIVVAVFATPVYNSIETVRCKRCKVKLISKQTTALKVRFYSLLEIVIRRLISNQVSPTDILASLPTEIASQLRFQGATTITDIFCETGPLYNSLNWYSFRNLVLLVREYGDAKCKEELGEYIKILMSYLQSRSTRHPTHATMKNTTTATNTVVNDTAPTIVLTDPEWDERLVKQEINKDERAYFASLLGTTENQVQFIQAIET